MAFYQSEQVVDFLAKALAEGKVTAFENGAVHQYASNVDGLILPNGDIYDRGQRFYAQVQAPVAAPVVEVKVEAKVEPEVKVEEPKVEVVAPKPRKTTAKSTK